MNLRVCQSCQVAHTGWLCWLCDGPTVERKIATPQGHVWHAFDYQLDLALDELEMETQQAQAS
jgi:hypothetical protein